MRHRVGIKHHHASHRLAGKRCRVEANLVGKTAVKQFHFLHGMHRRRLVTRSQHLGQHLPISLPIAALAHFHASLLRRIHATFIATVESQRVGKQHRSRQIALAERGTDTKQRIQILFRRIAVIDVRHGFVVPCAHIVRFHPRHGALHDLHHHGAIEMLLPIEPSTVGESLVAVERAEFPIGR